MNPVDSSPCEMGTDANAAILALCQNLSTEISYLRESMDEVAKEVAELKARSSTACNSCPDLVQLKKDVEELKGDKREVIGAWKLAGMAAAGGGATVATVTWVVNHVKF